MKITKKLLAAALAVTMVFTLVVAMPASAASTTINTSSDTFARFGSKEASFYGTQTYLGLLVKSAVTSRYLPYMRFDADETQKTAIASSPLVTLRLTVTQVNQLIPLTLYGIEDDTETPVSRKTGWTEATLNGTLATTLGLTDTANMTAISTYPATYAAKDVLEFDVTSYAKSQADGIFAFSLYSSEAMTTNTANRFASSNSSDATTHPVLVVYETGSDEYKTYLDARAVTLNESYAKNFTLPTSGANGSTIAWTSSDESVIAISGSTATVTRGVADSKVTLTATATCGSASYSVNYTVEVPAARSGDVFTYNSDLDGTYRRALSSSTQWNGTSYRLIQASENKRGMLVRFDTSTEDISSLTYAELTLAINTVGSDNLEKDVNVYPLYDVDADNMYKTGWTRDNYNTTYFTSLPDYMPDVIPYNLSNAVTDTVGSYSPLQIDVTDYVKSQSDSIAAFKLEVSGFSEAESQFKIFGSGTSNSANHPVLKVYFNKEGTVKKTAGSVVAPPTDVSDNFTLTTAVDDMTVTWQSSDASLIAVNSATGAATVTPSPEANLPVLLTATVTDGTYTFSHTYRVVVRKLAAEAKSFVYTQNDSAVTAFAPGAIAVAVEASQEIPADANMIAAVYDADGVLIDATMGAASKETPLALTLTESAASITAFMWQTQSVSPLLKEYTIFKTK